MARTEHTVLSRLSKPLACLLTVCALVFLLQVAPHTHANGHDEAACRVCQAAHLGVAPAVALPTLTVPLVAFGIIATAEAQSVSEFFYHQSPSRAPPASVL